jgi:hypothetical protein
MNKATMVAQGYSQQERIDYKETFAPVARFEAVRLLLSYTVNHGIILYQMDVKSAFINDLIYEEFYVKQPPRLEDLKHPDYVFKLKKSLYGLKQAPRAWYERLSNFLLEKGFKIGQVDTNHFRKIMTGHLTLFLACFSFNFSRFYQQNRGILDMKPGYSKTETYPYRICIRYRYSTDTR